MLIGFVLAKGEPIQSSSVQICHSWSITGNIKQIKNLTLILKIKYVLIYFSPVGHHKNQLDNLPLPSFQEGRNGFPWSYGWCSSQVINFQPSKPAYSVLLSSTQTMPSIFVSLVTVISQIFAYPLCPKMLHYGLISPPLPPTWSFASLKQLCLCQESTPLLQFWIDFH